MQPQGRLSSFAFSWTNKKGDTSKMRVAIKPGEVQGEVNRSYLYQKTNQFLQKYPEVEFPLVVTNDGRCSQDLRDPGLLLEPDPQGRSPNDGQSKIKLVTCQTRNKIHKQIDDIERWFKNEMEEFDKERQQDMQKIYRIAVLYGDPIYETNTQGDLFYDKLENTVSYEHEIRKIIDKIKQKKKNVLLQSKPATLKNLRELLSSSEDVSFLHLSLHGQSTGHLKFESEGEFGRCDKVTPRQLAEAIKSSKFGKLKIIFLMACYSGKFFEALKGEANMIVGFSDKQKMNDQAAQIFSSEFYEQILCRRTYKECWEAAVKSVDQVYRACVCSDQIKGQAPSFGSCKKQHKIECQCKLREQNIHTQECASLNNRKRFFERLHQPKTYWCCCCGFDHEHSKKFNYWIEKDQENECVLQKCQNVDDEEVKVGDYMNVPPLRGTYQVHFKTMHQFCRLMVKQQPLKRLFLVGQPGCGKTSFIKRLAQYIMARSQIEYSKIIYLNLKNYKHIIKFLARAEVPGLAHTFQAIKQEAKKQDCFFILDDCEELLSLDFEAFQKIIDKIQLRDNSKLIVIANEPLKPECNRLFESNCKKTLTLSIDLEIRFLFRKFQRKSIEPPKKDRITEKLKQWCPQSILKIDQLELPQEAYANLNQYVQGQLRSKQDNSRKLSEKIDNLQHDMLTKLIVMEAAEESKTSQDSILASLFEIDTLPIYKLLSRQVDPQIIQNLYANRNTSSAAILKIVDLMGSAMKKHVDFAKQLSLQESMLIIPQFPDINKLQFFQRIDDITVFHNDPRALVGFLRHCLRALATIRKKIVQLPMLQTKKISQVIVLSVVAACRRRHHQEDMCYQALAALELVKQQQDMQKAKDQILFTLLTFYNKKQTLQAIKSETQRSNSLPFLKLQYHYRLIEAKGVDQTKKTDLRAFFNHIKSSELDKKCQLFVLSCLKFILQNPECSKLFNDQDFKQIIQKIIREKEQGKSDQVKILILYLRYNFLRYETKSYESSEYKDIIRKLDQIGNLGELGKELYDKLSSESQELKHCRIKILVAERHHQDSFFRTDNAWLQRSLTSIKANEKRGATISSFPLTKQNLKNVLDDDCLLLALKCSLNSESEYVYLEDGKAISDLKKEIHQFVEEYEFSRARIILLCGRNVHNLGQKLNEFYHGHVIALELKEPSEQVYDSTLQFTKFCTIQQKFCEKFLTSFIEGLLDKKYSGERYGDIVDEVWLLSRYESLSSIVTLAKENMSQIEQKYLTLHRPTTYTGFEETMPMTTKFNSQPEINHVKFDYFATSVKWSFVKKILYDFNKQSYGLIVVCGNVPELKTQVFREVAYRMRVIGQQFFQEAQTLDQIKESTIRAILWNPDASSFQQIKTRSEKCVILMPQTQAVKNKVLEKERYMISQDKNEYFEKQAAIEVCCMQRHVSCSEEEFQKVVKNSGGNMKRFKDSIREVRSLMNFKGKKKGRQ